MSSLYEPSASIFIVMNLIPTPRGSGQRLNVTLLVGVELANTLRQLFAQTDSGYLAERVLPLNYAYIYAQALFESCYGI